MVDEASTDSRPSARLREVAARLSVDSYAWTWAEDRTLIAAEVEEIADQLDTEFLTTLRRLNWRTRLRWALGRRL